MAKSNVSLRTAKKAKNDEFYTRYEDIEIEMEAYHEYDHDTFRDKTVLCPCDDPEWSNFTRYFATNFERLGLKKLISTSYANSAGSRRLTPCEKDSIRYDASKHATHGKVFTLERTDGNAVSASDVRLSWYLDGNGDFRSDEVTSLRDEADIIITNPPFSLFREFLDWVIDGDSKRFAIIGNMNAITYKDVFPLLKDSRVWLGTTKPKEFVIPNGNGDVDMGGNDVRKFGNICWYTNIDHGLRHKPLPLMTMEQNLSGNARLRRRLERDYGRIEYPHYDNYDAIEVPFVECIPSDYDGIMGVPLTFLDKHCPTQFSIEGSQRWDKSDAVRSAYRGRKETADKDLKTTINGKETYDRIFIRRRTRPTTE